MTLVTQHLHSIKRSTHFRLKNLGENVPALYLGISETRLQLKGWTTDRVVTCDPKLVIEGYPRSGNSFAVKAFRWAQGDDGSHRDSERFKMQMLADGRGTHLADDTHPGTNVIKGVRVALPPLLIIRYPKDVTLGLCAYGVESDPVRRCRLPAKRIARKQIMLNARGYVRFYKPLLPLTDKLVVVDFADVISDFGPVTERINQ
jgi:hypothetical protein